MRGTDVAVVAPVYNERDNASELVEQLQQLFGELPYRLRVVLVNDGSDAVTTDLLDGLAARWDNVAVVHLSRNFGHQAALTAGLAHATGDAVITMDSDLQHPVRVIPDLLRAWEEGHDVVVTLRADAEAGLSLFKRLTSRWFYRFLNSVSPYPIPANAADFRLLDRKVLDVLNGLREGSRFLRGLTVWVGFRRAEVAFFADPRRSGTTKYSLGRMMSLALDGVVSLSTLPLRVALYAGSVVSLLALLYGLYVVASWWRGDVVSGWSSLMVALLFLSGLQINLLGVIGLYLGKIHEEVRGRPSYVVMRTAGLDR